MFVSGRMVLCFFEKKYAPGVKLEFVLLMFVHVEREGFGACVLFHVERPARFRIVRKNAHGEFAVFERENADGGRFRRRTATNVDGEAGAIRALRVEGGTVSMCGYRHIKRCVFEQRSPKFEARTIFVGIAENGDVADKHVVFGLFEILAFEFIF